MLFDSSCASVKTDKISSFTPETFLEKQLLTAHCSGGIMPELRMRERHSLNRI